MQTKPIFYKTLQRQESKNHNPGRTNSILRMRTAHLTAVFKKMSYAITNYQLPITNYQLPITKRKCRFCQAPKVEILTDVTKNGTSARAFKLGDISDSRMWLL